MTIRSIRSPYLRALVLMLIGVPCLSNWPLVLIAPDMNSFEFLGMWLLYMVFIHAVILREAGAEQWITWAAAACVLALFTVSTAVVVLNGLDLVGVSLKDAAGTSYTKVEWSWDQLRKGLTIVTVVPFAVFVLHCFSFAAGLDRAARWGGRGKSWSGHLLIIIRMAQHASEILLPMVLIWREEHPDIIRPRLRKDLSSLVGNTKSVIAWILAAVLIWTRAALTRTLEPIPMFCWTVETQLIPTRTCV